MTQASDTQQYAVTYHAPIMVREIVEAIVAGWPADARARGEIVVLDATLGGGGHTHALLDALGEGGRVIALDRDPEALEHVRERLSAYGDRFTCAQANYSQAREVLDRLGVEAVHGLVLDAGVSSHQLDDPERGFSFREAGPLDMRMGDDAMPLGQWLDGIEERALTQIIREYGELKKPHLVARAILRARGEGKLEDTAQLREIVERSVFAPRKLSVHPATLVFQALRIAVNDELRHLAQVVEALPELLHPGARAAFLSFHSLEDRIIKRGLRSLERPQRFPPGVPVTAEMEQGVIEILTGRPVGPTDDEIAANPRARSAKLRLAARRAGA